MKLAGDDSMATEIQIKEKVVNGLKELDEFKEDLSKGKDKWVFRGEQFNDNQKDSLKTSLEKAFDNISFSIRSNELGKHKICTEIDIIREFQRKLHLYTSNLPTRADILQWLSLMQLRTLRSTQTQNTQPLAN